MKQNEVKFLDIIDKKIYNKNVMLYIYIYIYKIHQYLAKLGKPSDAKL
jgi:hypothetical protein